MRPLGSLQCGAGGRKKCPDLGELEAVVEPLLILCRSHPARFQNPPLLKMFQATEVTRH
jgi:hypothetical protein